MCVVYYFKSMYSVLKMAYFSALFRYLLQIMMEANCLEIASLISVLLKDALALIRIVNAARSTTPGDANSPNSQWVKISKKVILENVRGKKYLLQKSEIPDVDSSADVINSWLASLAYSKFATSWGPPFCFLFWNWSSSSVTHELSLCSIWLLWQIFVLIMRGEI